MSERTDQEGAGGGAASVPATGIAFGAGAERISRASRQAFYRWDIASDKITWSGNFTRIAGLEPHDTRHLTGRGYETQMGSQSHKTRFGAVMSGGGDGTEEVAYQCIYVLHEEEAGEAVWLEDSGTWYPGADGRPRYAEGSVRVINNRRRHEEALRRQSDFDDLTGLPNRRSLEKLIARSIHDNLRDGRVSTLIILAIDRLELINSIHGFSTGDEVLRKCGDLIRLNLRADDAVCRFSGAKFGIILHDCPPAEIYDAAGRLLGAIAAEVIETKSGYVSVNAVAGACFLPSHAKTPPEALQAAFRAIRQARRETSARIGVYEPSPEADAAAREKARFSRAVIEAVADGRLRLAYQPVVSASGTVAFYEALVRMEEPDGTTLDAGRFISLIEELGLIRFVDNHALRLVLKTLADYPDAHLSINVSRDTVHDPDWISTLATGLAAIEGGSSRLIVEITESLAVTDLKETGRFIETLRSLGCRVAIDDFGAGFTSFSSLKDLPVDMIKIDGSFGVKLASCKENQAFVKALLALAKVFGMETVVEWVEDEDTAMMLNGWNVDYQQGHRFGRPMLTPPWPRATSDRKDERSDLAPDMEGLAG